MADSPIDRAPSAGQAEAARAPMILEVDLSAAAANWALLCRHHRHGAVGALVKADGYGLGARPIAARLYRAGCRHFFVAHLDEAVAIRDAVADAMVAVLNGLTRGDEGEYVARGILPVLGSLDEIEAWRAEAGRRGQALEALLHIDTGMSRLGLDRRELAILSADHGRLAGIALRYVMTHLVAAEIQDDPLNEAQRRRFAQACAGLPKVRRSLANSSGIFLGERFGSDLARPGAALYGINPTPGRANPMRPVVRLLGRVLQVRTIEAGATVGYNGTWTAPATSRIATVGVGYADGWFRSLSGRGEAFFDGRPVPLVGRVSMDLTTYDVTGQPGIGAGSYLELIGPSIPPDRVAEMAGTNGYEVLTSLGRRSARIYRGI